ncbi:RICIN domain-containing protein [Catenuloplanes sp. NPDC051500]|uniref:RICIN domain-containing protein n=1 Tax=Catenuloplanes sp. NPDC051500 TaxID=3363959 RepID=UPI0037A9DB2F
MATKSVPERVTALRSVGVRAWRSLRTTRQRVEAGVALTAAIACIVAAGIQVGPALADPKIEGLPVPDAVLPALVIGATSCPTITAPRLAAQLMAASEFKVTAKSDIGEGLAGLNAEEWKKWAPWQQAARTDVLANVLALAHRTCEATGQARTAKVGGDLWEAAVAAERVGVAAVIAKKGVPDAAQDHVDRVTGYANWYAEQPQFTGDGQAAVPTSSSGVDAPGMSLPDEFVEPVLKAGQICPAVAPPARIAAQLMALSAFNPNLRGSNGGMGIAQFTEATWKQYRPSANASVWAPESAIPALGTAMCDLRNQLSGLKLTDKDGAVTDSYTLALAAFQWGITAVRAEGGVPRKAAVAQLPDMVESLSSIYDADTRLALNKPSPSPSVSSSSSPSPSPSQTSSPSPSPSASLSPSVTPQPSKTSQAPPASKWNPAVSWKIVNVHYSRLLEVPGFEDSNISGTTVHMWDTPEKSGVYDRDQYWRIADPDNDGWVTITNALFGKALGVRDKSTALFAEVVILDPVAGDKNQQWQLKELGNGQYNIINRNSGKALDISGDDCCGGNSTPITQYDLQDYAVDQKWTLNK